MYIVVQASPWVHVKTLSSCWKVPSCLQAVRTHSYSQISANTHPIGLNSLEFSENSTQIQSCNTQSFLFSFFRSMNRLRAARAVTCISGPLPLIAGGCCALRMYDSHQLMDTWVVSRFLIYILFSGFESYISFLYNSFDYCSCFFHVGHSKRSEDTGTILAVKTIPSISFLICKASCGVLIVFLPLISQE